jgi:hypothetical protein
MAKPDGLTAAKAFELAKQQTIKHDLTAEADRRVKQVMAAHVASGQAAQGPPTEQFADIRKEVNSKIIGEAIHTRRLLIESTPELGSEVELMALHRELDKFADEATRGAGNVVFPRPRSGRPGMTKYLAGHAVYFKAKIQREIDVLRHETKLSKPRNEREAIHISTGDGSIVTIGDVTNSILSTLRESSADQALIGGLSDLTRVIRETERLNPDTQSLALEQLAFMVRQVNTDKAQREKPEAVQAVWNSFVVLISVAADVAQVASVVGPLLLAHFRVG